MSIASMVDTKLTLQQAQDPQKASPEQPVGVSTNIVNQITRWIPTETITVYVALLALVAPLAPHSPSFTSRWVLFWLMTAANPVVVILLTMAKKQSGDRFKVNIQAPGLGVAASDRELRFSVGFGVAVVAGVVSGMIEGCDRCAAGGAVRGSA